jgi:hypothetical protein
MLASVELTKRENRYDLDFLQMNGYVPCGIISISVYFAYQKQVPVEQEVDNMSQHQCNIGVQML